MWRQRELWTIRIRRLDLLGELATDPGCSIQHLTDAHSLHVARQEVGVVQQSGHLSHGEAPDGLDPDGHIQHLRGDEMAVPGALQPRQLHQDADIPAEQRHAR